MIKIKSNKTKDELIKMYINSLNEGEIPWRKRWINTSNINGITKKEYKGINQLLLNYVAYKEQYEDNRWFTYKQVIDLGYKLKNAKNKGIPVAFWSSYNYRLKKKFNFEEYEEYITIHPNEKDDFKIFERTAVVFNGSLVDGLKPNKTKFNNIETSKYITMIIDKLDIKYEEKGNQAFYNPIEDKITLPEKTKFIDQYSYYATQLHEICHSTGNKKRLDRNLISNGKEDYAREELIAEISSSFLMQRLNIPANAKHFDNHKAYIKSWISILNDQPKELFKAISTSDKVCDYIEKSIKAKEKIIER